jgi:hypothetical protein
VGTGRDPLVRKRSFTRRLPLIIFLFAFNSFTGDTCYWDNFDNYAAEED